jgi:hypothetical protein
MAKMPMKLGSWNGTLKTTPAGALSGVTESRSAVVFKLTDMTPNNRN